MKERGQWKIRPEEAISKLFDNDDDDDGGGRSEGLNQKGTRSQNSFS
jgi:hypothetical protein